MKDYVCRVSMKDYFYDVDERLYFSDSGEIVSLTSMKDYVLHRVSMKDYILRFLVEERSCLCHLSSQGRTDTDL